MRIRFSFVQRNANSLLICAENRELPSHWYKNCEPASHWCIGLHTCFSLVQRTTSSLLISAENCKLASHRCRGLQAPSHWCISAEDYTSSLLIGAEGYKLASHWWRKLRARFSLVQRATSLLLIGGENCELASHWCRGLRSSCVAILLLAWYWRLDRRDRPRWRVGRTQKDRLVMEEKNTINNFGQHPK